MEFPFFVPQFVVKTDFAQGKWNCHDENKTICLRGKLQVSTEGLGLI